MNYVHYIDLQNTPIFSHGWVGLMRTDWALLFVACNWIISSECSSFSSMSTPSLPLSVCYWGNLETGQMIFITVYLPQFATTNALAIQIKLFHVQIMLKGQFIYQLSGLIEISTCEFAVSSFKQVPVPRGLCAVVLLCHALLHFILSHLECQISEVSLCLHICR